jgi:hypothetical protein
MKLIYRNRINFFLKLTNQGIFTLYLSMHYILIYNQPIFYKHINIMVTVIKKGTSKEEIKKRINEAVSKTPKKDIMKYAGKLKLTGIDPLEYQKKMRDEWE